MNDINGLQIMVLLAFTVFIMRLIISNLDYDKVNSDLSLKLSLARKENNSLNETIKAINEHEFSTRIDEDCEFLVGDLVYDKELMSYAIVIAADPMTGVDICTDLYGNERFNNVDVRQLSLVAGTSLNNEAS